MASLTAPFRRTYRYMVSTDAAHGAFGILTSCVHQQIQAHENPVLFYSVVIGCIGPVMAVTVPPIRERMGYKKAPEIPQTYPCAFMSRLFRE